MDLKKKNNSLPFFDILLINNSKMVVFKVYRKNNNKNDCTHFIRTIAIKSM